MSLENHRTDSFVIDHTPLLTFEQEISFAKTVEAGRNAAKKLGKVKSEEEKIKLQGLIEAGLSARTELIHSNLRLVKNIAAKYKDCSIDFEDLEQEGRIGLIKAVERYDWRRGVRFATFATWWVRKEIARSIEEKARTIRVSTRVAELLSKYWKFKNNNGPEVDTPEAVAAALNIKLASAKNIIDVSRRKMISLDELPENEVHELAERLPDVHAVDPETRVVASFQKEQIREALEKLSPREAKVITLSFGLNGGEENTLKKVALKLGVGRGTAKRIKQIALRKLRNSEMFELWRA